MANFEAILGRIRDNDPTLTSINFSGLRDSELGNEGVKRLAEALKDNTTLKEINFRYHGIEGDGVKALASALENNTTLKRIDLRGNPIGDEGAKALASALEKNTALEEISLHGCAIESAGAKDLASAIEGSKSLKSLDLHSNAIGDIGVKALASALNHNTSLKELNLNNCGIRIRGVRDLAEALKNNESLKILHLGSNKEIGLKGFKTLIDEIKDSKNLKKLDLSKNNLKDKGVEVVVDLIKDNKRLEELDLSGNGIKEKGVQALAGVLNSTILIKLNLYENKIGNEGFKFIASALKNNKTLEEIDLDLEHSLNSVALSLVNAFEEKAETRFNIILTSLGSNKMGPAFGQPNTSQHPTLNNLIQRNKDLPKNIADKIYQSFMQKQGQQGQGQAQIVPSEPLLNDMESRLIAISPRACVKILELFLKKDGISGRKPKELFDHIRNGIGLNGSKILLASYTQSEEQSKALNLDHDFTVKEFLLAQRVAKDITQSPSMFAGLPDEVLGKILGHLEMQPKNSPQNAQANQLQQPSLNSTQNPR